MFLVLVFYVVCVLQPLCKGAIYLWVCAHVCCVVLLYYLFLFYCYGHMPDTNQDHDDDYYVLHNLCHIVDAMRTRWISSKGEWEGPPETFRTTKIT